VVSMPADVADYLRQPGLYPELDFRNPVRLHPEVSACPGPTFRQACTRRGGPDCEPGHPCSHRDRRR